MSNEFRERRKENRSSAGLSAVVKGRESKADFWKESTDLVTVSRIGASFELQRACQVGRILSILANMPANLRCYDEDKKQYRVWGLVQHCSPVYENPDLFLVGVAFIGKYAPKTYLEDPLRTYRVVGMDEEGFWNVGETKEPFVSRAYHRFKYAAGVKLGNLKTEGEANSIDFDAVTEDVGSGGASVFTSLDVETGDAVRFVCDEFEFESLSVVRNRQTREGGRTTVHVEFAEPNFPIIDISFREKDDEDDSSENKEARPIVSGTESPETRPGHAEETAIMNQDDSDEFLETNDESGFDDAVDTVPTEDSSSENVSEDDTDVELEVELEIGVEEKRKQSEEQEEEIEGEDQVEHEERVEQLENEDHAEHDDHEEQKERVEQDDLQEQEVDVEGKEEPEDSENEIDLEVQDSSTDENETVDEELQESEVDRNSE